MRRRRFHHALRRAFHRGMRHGRRRRFGGRRLRVGYRM